MRRLLETAVRHNIMPEYANQLLHQFTSAATGDTPHHPITPSPSYLLTDPLTPRETEVLQLITQGLTNKEIATRLVIAPSTAKRHTINLYNKLVVNNRAEATARAYELGLMDETRGSSFSPRT